MDGRTLKYCRWFPLMLTSVLVIGCSRGDQVQHVAKPVAEDPVADATDETEASVPLSATTDAVTDATAPPTESSPEPASKPSGREPIYDTEADGAALIAAAMERAKRDHKHVLIEWGGNWCGWCFKLHDVFTGSEEVRPIVHEDYELVLIDQGANRELMESYGGKDTRYAFPHLTILDAEGKVLVNQETGSLEEGPVHDTAKVATFLKEWAPERRNAEEVLANALERATREDKCVLMHVGTPYCGWCRVLSQFLHDHEELFAGDYIDLKIDTLRMKNGEEVAERYQPGDSLGIPWTVILDASGKVLATSVGPDGNCGYPYHEAEIEHFVSMLTATRKRMSDADIATIRADLHAYREKRERDKEADSNAAATQDALPQSSDDSRTYLVEFVDAPLDIFCDYMRDLTGLPVQFDREALASAGINVDEIRITYEASRMTRQEADEQLDRIAREALSSYGITATRENGRVILSSSK